MNLKTVTDRTAWDHYVGGHPFGHPLQLWGWGEAKRGSGWEPVRLALEENGEWAGAVQVLLWRIPKLGREIAYIPRGPVVDPETPESTRLLAEVAHWAKERKVVYLRIEPAWHKAALGKGWKKSKHHVQLPETYVIDLTKSSEDLLAPMSHKHRQYIRKSERDGVEVSLGTEQDLDAVYGIYVDTAKRAGFGIHGAAYYRDLLGELGERNYLYIARAEGQPVAFLWLASAGKTAYELYGGVTGRGGELKANYFLKWQAICAMKAAGYEIYDFNGRLNEGVSRFKDGFGPDAVDYIGTWDLPVNRLGYEVWEKLWPVAKPMGRWAAKLRRH